MNDPERFFDQVKRTMEGEVIRKLLASNDTLCFTTQQFADARQKWLKDIGCDYRALNIVPTDEIKAYELVTSRNQLTALPQLVREVSPDIWTLPEGITQ